MQSGWVDDDADQEGDDMTPPRIPRIYHAPCLPHTEPRVSLSIIVFWIAVLGLAAILGSLHAAWWQVGIAGWLVWLVRFTARREGL
jgi:hypothetical protein